MNSLEIQITNRQSETSEEEEIIIELIDLVKNSGVRFWVGFKLNKHLPDIATYFHSLQDKNKYGNAAFHHKFTELLQLIREDFLKTKKRDWIDIFLAHKVSPLSFKVVHQYAPLDSDQLQPAPDLTRAEKFLQRTNQRTELHRLSFTTAPTTSISASFYHLYPDSKDPFHAKMRSILKELMNSNAVIPNNIHHWTTLSNLQSILWEGNIYGNTHLRDLKKYFQRNSLSRTDISNGDGDVICFAPYLIDPLALVDEGKNTLKEDLVRLTIDIEKAPYHWEMQHFFKIRDLGVPTIIYKVKINDKLSFEFNRLGHNAHTGISVIIKFKQGNIDKFKEWTIEHEINKTDSIFYGNYFAINQFCMDQLPRILKHADSEFLSAFNAYLSTLEDNEIKKIFVIFAQSLTIYCEYNVNHKLKVKDNLITHIYLANQNELFNLSSLSRNDYQSVCEQIKSDGIIPLTSTQPHKPLIEFNDDIIRIYDTEIWYRQRYFNLVKDFSELNPDYFAQGYYETRPGLDTKAPVMNNNNNKFGFK